MEAMTDQERTAMHELLAREVMGWKAVNDCGALWWGYLPADNKYTHILTEQYEHWQPTDHKHGWQTDLAMKVWCGEDMARVEAFEKALEFILVHAWGVDEVRPYGYATATPEQKCLALKAAWESFTLR